MPRLNGFGFLYVGIVGVYQRFALNFADLEDLLAERGVAVNRETIR